ncbi:MAG: DUF4276 family protein [Bacteroidales bacterium]|nr:DUF4276 family protein [Bacteroidales bacterium]
MKRLYIVVEGQTEQEFVRTVMAKYLTNYRIYSVAAVPVKTSKTGRGGLVNYQHLKNTIQGLLKESNSKDMLVTTFVDYFRIPSNMPGYEQMAGLASSYEKVSVLERAMSQDINDIRFVPYIQLHEFEALLFSDNSGFEYYYKPDISSKTARIVEEFANPEDINSKPETSPSNRIMAIIPQYEKVVHGNLIALTIGIEPILKRCPRFAQWTESIVKKICE